MINPRYLTKSRFKLAVECPTKLFYTGKTAVYWNRMKDDSFMSMLAEGGYQVGELAKYKFPGGIEIKSLNSVEAEAQTNELLQQSDVVLFEPAIRYGDLFVRIDILVKKGNSFRLIEVKAKSYDSREPKLLGARGGIVSGMRPYIEDVAFQAYVLRGAYPSASVTTALMMPDKALTADINGLNQLFKLVRDGERSNVVPSPQIKTHGVGRDILALVNVDEYVAMVMRDGVECDGAKQPLDDLAQQWAIAYKTDVKIPPTPGARCSSCEFSSPPSAEFKSGFKECWSQAFGFTDSDFEQGTALDLWNYRGKDRLISNGRVRLKSVQREDLGDSSSGPDLSNADRQWMQVDGIPSAEDRGGYWLSDSLMRSEISSWKFPYHLIDFETSAVALPFHQGMRPYEQVAFQFSHHVMHQDGRVEHAGEFLMGEPGQFPNFEFARALKAELDKDEGTIFMWSHHENTILNRIMIQLDESLDPPPDASELISFLKSVTKGGDRAMYDLANLSRQAFFHPDTKGSSSIKKVLPAMLKASPWLHDRYGQSIYGSPTGIPSKNYKDPFTWWKLDADGNLIEPYERLRVYAQEMLGEEVRTGEDPDHLVIAEGGAAATAYSRLQFEDLSDVSRQGIKEGLLRYCELDTLAMVMIVEGWREMVR
jgi:hypothetical protein